MNFMPITLPNDEYKLAHEQYRGFVLFHRTQAATARAMERDNPEGAIDAVLDGLKRMGEFFAEHDLQAHGRRCARADSAKWSVHCANCTASRRP